MKVLQSPKDNDSYNKDNVFKVKKSQKVEEKLDHRQKRKINENSYGISDAESDSSSCENNDEHGTIYDDVVDDWSEREDSEDFSCNFESERLDNEDEDFNSNFNDLFKPF